MSRVKPLVAPFPYFGGKSAAAWAVWDALGRDIGHFIEPFAGSLAVLLSEPARPDRLETVNDCDGYVVNAWRAMRADPEAVAAWADHPVFECDLHARHLWLVNEGRPDVARLMTDPDYCDLKAAGWWIWGLCCWIGGGWCDGRGPWTVDRLLGTDGNAGPGVSRKRPHLSNAGKGVHRKLPHLRSTGQGVHGSRRARIVDWFTDLADRLARVRICCGDWSRIVTPAVLFAASQSDATRVGIFLDPPYRLDNGRDRLYTHETDVAAEVAAWAFTHGDDPRLRIVLAGWDGDVVLPDGWRALTWTKPGGNGYANQSGRQTQVRERLWLSPGCQKPTQLSFDVMTSSGAEDRGRDDRMPSLMRQ